MWYQSRSNHKHYGNWMVSEHRAQSTELFRQSNLNSSVESWEMSNIRPRLAEIYFRRIFWQRAFSEPKHLKHCRLQILCSHCQASSTQTGGTSRKGKQQLQFRPADVDMMTTWPTSKERNNCYSFNICTTAGSECCSLTAFWEFTFYTCNTH